VKPLQQQFSIAQIKKIDVGGVYRAYRDWPALARGGFEARVDPFRRQFRKAYVLGMGGSAAGGDIIAGWLSNRKSVEFSVIKEPTQVPDMREALAIVCSASGQTEETISMLKTAVERHATVTCISSGGRLKAEAERLGVNHIDMPKIVAPRYMLPFIVFSSLAVANRAMDLRCDDEVEESISMMELLSNEIDIDTPTAANRSKQLAQKLLEKTPVVYGSRVTRGVGIRFKNALNENAKKHSYFDMMPDLFHNEIEAWEDPDPSFQPIFLKHSGEEDSERLRAEAMSEMLSESGRGPMHVGGFGRSSLAQLVTMAYQLDMATYFIAIGLGRDPLPTKLIDRLKGNGTT